MQDQKDPIRYQKLELKGTVQATCTSHFSWGKQPGWEGALPAVLKVINSELNQI